MICTSILIDALLDYRKLSGHSNVNLRYSGVHTVRGISEGRPKTKEVLLPPLGPSDALNGVVGISYLSLKDEDLWSKVDDVYVVDFRSLVYWIIIDVL